MFRALVISSIALLAAVKTAAQEQRPFGVFWNYRLSPVSVNSPGNEYAPVLINGELLFTSDNREQLGMYVSPSDSTRLMNLFRARQINDTLFEEPVLLDGRLNRFSNGGPGTLTAAGDRIFFSANEETQFLVYTSRKAAKLRIYTSVFDGKKWSERTVLPFATDDANYTHPFVTAGGDTLYFASDRKGSLGGFDLYRSVLSEGAWSEPENLGYTVNTASNELFPCFADHVLWYSTDHPRGLGGLDIRGIYLGKNGLYFLGTPFNTSADDFSYFPVDGRKGYFSSNRSGNDELFFYKQLFPDFRDCEPYVRDKFCYTFFEETEELDTGLALAYEWTMGDGTVIREKEAHHCFGGYGEYLVELNIVDRTTSEVYFTQASYPFAIEPTERLHIEGPDTIPTGTEATYSAMRSSLPGYGIEDFYWELAGQRRWSKVDTAVVSFAEPGTHSLIMGVTAVSDEGVEEEFCVVKQIVAQDGYVLPEVKLPIAFSFEEAADVDTTVIPLVPDSKGEEVYTLFLGVSDTLINDLSLHEDDTVRVEPVGDSLYLYSVGATSDKFELLSDYREAQEMGFKDSRVTQLGEDGRLVHEQQLADTKIVDPEKILNDRIRTEQILASFEVFYGYNVFALTAENKRQLAQLASTHPLTGEFRVLITSFTDSKGNDAYNLELSKKRSESVRNELVANGYPADRIELEYYGRRVPDAMEPLNDAQRRKSLIIIYEKEK